jgi:hypothetical protein
MTTTAIKSRDSFTPSPVPSAVEVLSKGWKAKKHRCTLDEVRAMFAGQDDRYPIIMTLGQAAALVGLKPQTLRKHRSEGKYTTCSSDGHPVRFFRDQFVCEFMGGGRQ